MSDKLSVMLENDLRVEELQNEVIALRMEMCINDEGDTVYELASMQLDALPLTEDDYERGIKDTLLWLTNNRTRKNPYELFLQHRLENRLDKSKQNNMKSEIKERTSTFYAVFCSASLQVEDMWCQTPHFFSTMEAAEKIYSPTNPMKFYPLKVTIHLPEQEGSNA